MKILFVDDDPNIRERCRHFLECENENIQVDTIDTIKNALAKIKECKYDAIVSAYKLHEEDGLKLLEIIRKERRREIPFILLPEDGSESVAIKALNHGADRYIQKERVPKKFYRTLREALINEVEEQSKEEAYRDLFEDVADTVFICNSDLQILDVNSSASEQLGYSKKELVSMEAKDIICEEQKDKLERIRHLIRGEHQKTVFECEQVAKNGKRIPVEVICSQVTYAGQPASLCLVQGISKRKRTEETIYNVTSAMISQIGSKELFQNIVNNARRVTNAKFVVLSLYNKKKESLTTKIVAGAGLTLLNRISNIFGVNDLFEIEFQVNGAPRFKKFSQQKEQEPIILDGFQEYTFGRFNDRLCTLVEKVIGIEEIAAIPLFNNNDELIGILSFLFPNINKARSFTPLMIFGDLAAQAIGKSRRIDQLIETKEKLKESEKKYRAIVEQTHDFIGIYKEDRFLFVNDQYSDIHGYTKEELYNMKIWKLFPPQERKRVQKIAQKRKKGKQAPSKYEVKILTKKGTIKHCEVAVSSITYEGEYANLIAGRNITKRKKHEQKITALHTWAQRLNKAETMDIIFEHTLDAMEQTLGFEHADVSLKTEEHLTVKAYKGYNSLPEKLHSLPLWGNGITVQVAKTGNSILAKDVTQHPDYLPTSPKINSELAVPIKTENEVIGVLNVESEDKYGFDRLDKQLLEMLASHVVVAIKELQEKKKRVSLQQLHELRTQFLAMAAHEINTPLTPIKTNLEMLQQEYFGKLTETQQKRISQTLESVNRLTRLVNDFRHTSKLRATHIPLNKKTHQLTDTIEKALEKYKDAFIEKEIMVIKKLEQPLKAIYDEDRMVQVIRNLVENAIDYTEDTIWIKGGVEGETIWIAVQDNGPGIPNEEQKKIFQPFYRVEDDRSRKNRQYGGTGLGLNICKQIVEAHKGKIQVNSQPREGSTFKVIFPKNRK